jgi:hypothetical protein
VLRFGVELEAVALVVQRLHALPQLVVQVDRVRVGSQLRRHLAVDRIQPVVGVRALQVREGGRHARQQLARALHRDDGVVERRRRLAVRDRGDFLQMLAHAGFEGRLEVLVLDLVEGRIVERQRTDLGERIRGVEGGWGCGCCCYGGDGGGCIGKRDACRDDEAVGLFHAIFHGHCIDAAEASPAAGAARS